MSTHKAHTEKRLSWHQSCSDSGRRPAIDGQAVESTAWKHAIGRRITNPVDTDHNHTEEGER